MVQLEKFWRFLFRPGFRMNLWLGSKAFSPFTHLHQKLQTMLSQYVYFSLILRKLEETKTKYSAPKYIVKEGDNSNSKQGD